MWPAETLGLVLAGRKLSSRPVSAVVGLYSECSVVVDVVIVSERHHLITVTLAVVTVTPALEG